jgi:hypothetical protein
MRFALMDGGEPPDARHGWQPILRRPVRIVVEPSYGGPAARFPPAPRFTST